MVSRKDASHESPYVIDNVGKYQHELSLLLCGAKIRKYRANEVVCQEGEVADRFYFITKGRVRVSMSGPDGTEKIVAINDKGTLNGESSLDNRPYMMTAVTTEESELYVIENTHFVQCVRRCPEVAFMVLESVIGKARNLHSQVADLSLLKSKGRVAHILFKLAREIGTRTDDGIVIQKKITHETLAGLTGLARPTLTSVLGDLERSNVITKKNHRIIILDERKLLDVVDNIPD